MYHWEPIGDTPNQNKIIAVRITGAKHNDEVQQRIYIQCLIHGSMILFNEYSTINYIILVLIQENGQQVQPVCATLVSS